MSMIFYASDDSQLKGFFIVFIFYQLCIFILCSIRCTSVTGIQLYLLELFVLEREDMGDSSGLTFTLNNNSSICYHQQEMCFFITDLVTVTS